MSLDTKLFTYMSICCIPTLFSHSCLSLFSFIFEYATNWPPEQQPFDNYHELAWFLWILMSAHKDLIFNSEKGNQ